MSPGLYPFSSLTILYQLFPGNLDGHVASCLLCGPVVKIPERKSVKCYMFHNERLSPEGARGTFLITALCREAAGTWHGATSHLETAAARPYVRVPSQICLLPTTQQTCHLLTSLVEWPRLQKRAGIYTFELLARVYSFDKYLLSLPGERDTSLDIALKLRIEEANHLWKSSKEGSAPVGITPHQSLQWRRHPLQWHEEGHRAGTWRSWDLEPHSKCFVLS